MAIDIPANEAAVVQLPLLLTMMETATLLRLGRTQTYELVMSGRISSVTIGRRRLILRASVEEFVRKLLEEQNLAKA
jgi:excisionase family DNA binding protein